MPSSFQLNLPFGPQPWTGKKTARITIACDPEFKDFVKNMMKLTGESESEIGHRYFINGLKGDLGDVFMASPHMDKKLSDFLKR